MAVDPQLVRAQQRITGLQRFLAAAIIDQEGYIYVSNKQLEQANTGDLDRYVLRWEQAPNGMILRVVDPHTNETPHR